MKPTPIPVILESPYAGDTPLHLQYLRACLHDSLMRDEAPFASHALYTQPGVLRDEVQRERDHGIEAGFRWRAFAHLTVFYTDLGWSSGMVRARDVVTRDGGRYEVRFLGPTWQTAQIERESQSAATDHWRRTLRWST